MAGDEDGLEVVAAVGDDAHRLDDRDLAGTKCQQQAVFAPGKLRGQFLQCVERAVVVDEPNDVAPDPPHDACQPLRLELFERLVPGEVEEVRVARTGDELEVGSHFSMVPTGRDCDRRGGRESSTLLEAARSVVGDAAA